MKNNDVYRFQYNDEQRKKIFMSDHCFDGQLVFRDGMLYDTYWGLDLRGLDGRCFTPEEAVQHGELTFVCNLDEVAKVSEHAYPQYADEDSFNLSHQHGCYKYFAVRKGAKKSVAKQLAILDERVKRAKEEAGSAMRAAFNCIERSHEQAVRLAAGEDVSI